MLVYQMVYILEISISKLLGSLFLILPSERLVVKMLIWLQNKVWEVRLISQQYLLSYNAVQEYNSTLSLSYKTHKVYVVADGVGGWAEQGIDAGHFSRAFMKLIQEQYETAKRRHRLLPLKSVTKTYQKMYRGTIPGSCTVCCLHLHDDRLYTYNLGDSGFYHLRKKENLENSKDILEKKEGWKLIFASTPQCYSFNFPYQLGHESGNKVKLNWQLYRTTHKTGFI